MNWTHKRFFFLFVFPRQYNIILLGPCCNFMCFSLVYMLISDSAKIRFASERTKRRRQGREKNRWFWLFLDKEITITFCKTTNKRRFNIFSMENRIHTETQQIHDIVKSKSEIQLNFFVNLLFKLESNINKNNWKLSQKTKLISRSKTCVHQWIPDLKYNENCVISNRFVCMKSIQIGGVFCEDGWKGESSNGTYTVSQPDWLIGSCWHTQSHQDNKMGRKFRVLRDFALTLKCC